MRTHDIQMPLSLVVTGCHKIVRRFTALINNTVVRTMYRLAVEAAKCWQDVNSTREGDAVNPSA